MDETTLVETLPEPSSEIIKQQKKSGEDLGKGSLLFFAKLLETKKQVDRESRAARISNLSIV
jgi:hypothetical protein